MINSKQSMFGFQIICFAIHINKCLLLKVFTAAHRFSLMGVVSAKLISNYSSASQLVLLGVRLYNLCYMYRMVFSHW